MDAKRTACTIAVGATAELTVAACGGHSSSHGGVVGPSEVRAEPVAMATANPFSPPVGADRHGITPPPAAASSSGGPSTYRANLPGLYGGTRDHRSCNAVKLVDYLEHNPDKARAWASTLGIQRTQIRSYVSGLTAVLLRTDTRVTNHGYDNGTATSIQSVLEAGTAVFVDKYGSPVVKCYCGNPLTPPELLSQPRYVGPLWRGFSTTNITVIHQSTTIINVFQLYDPATGELFPRTPGLDGSDGPYSGTAAGAPTPGGTAQNLSASFSPNPGHRGDNFTLSISGFTPSSTASVELTRPDGVLEHYTIDVGGDGSGSHTFANTNNVVTGTYSATVTDHGTGRSTQASVDVLPSSSPGGQSTTEGSSGGQSSGGESTDTSGSNGPQTSGIDTSGSTDTTGAGSHSP